jgi:integrase
MAIITTDRHGHYGKDRKADGPKLDRGTTRYFARVAKHSSKGYVTRREALDAEAEMRRRFQSVAPQHSAITVAEFGTTVWLPLKSERLKPSAYAEVQYAWAKIEAGLGDVRLRDLKPTHLRAFYTSLSTRGTTVAEKAHKSLSNLLALAVDDGYIERNVAKVRDVRPRRTHTEMSFWSPVEVREFLDAVAGDRLFACWRLAAMTGMRRAELLGLRWTDLDLEAGTLRVERGLVLTPTGEVVWSTPKTDRSRRTVDLDEATIVALRAHRKGQMAEQLASLGAWPEDGDEAGLVFTDEAGRPLRPAYLSRRFGDLVRKVSGLQRVRLHDLRHTHATILLRDGVPVHVVSARLGHASPSITLDFYAHVLRDQSTDAAARFAAAIDG